MTSLPQALLDVNVNVTSQVVDGLFYAVVLIPAAGKRAINEPGLS